MATPESTEAFGNGHDYDSAMSDFELADLTFDGSDPRLRGNMFIESRDAREERIAKKRKEVAEATQDTDLSSTVIDRVKEESRQVMLKQFPGDPHLVPGD